MSTLAEHAITALREAGAVLTPGLTADELGALEEHWGSSSPPPRRLPAVGRPAR